MSNAINLFRNGDNAKTTKNKSEYENYEDDFSNYRNKNKSSLSQWNMLSSRIVSPQLLSKSKVSASVAVGKDDISEKSEARKRNVELSRISESTNKTETARMYGEKIKQQFEHIQVDKKSNEEVQRQLKSMRQMLIQLNELVSSKLNKYQLVQLEQKESSVPLDPQKQQQLLKLKIENNTKILESLEREKKQIEEREKELQQKDYLIELEETTNIIFKSLKQKKKEKHHQGVAVEKLDSKLIEMRDAELDDQYKMVKILKHNILYYFKKFHGNKKQLDELDRNYKDLTFKDELLTKKYNEYAKIAEQKNMLVKANRAYVENKKISDEFAARVEQEKKKLDIIRRSKQLECDKLEKEIDNYKKQTVSIEFRIDDVTVQVAQCAENINDTVQKHQISNKLMSKISYKFAESLLKDSSGNTNYSGNQPIQQSQLNNKVFSRPKIKTIKLQNSVEYSAQTSSRYQTVNPDGMRSPNQKLNDKNMETIDNPASKSKDFRIKPGLNIKKRNDDRSRLELSDFRDADKGEEINYKPKRFQKILSQRKDKESVL